MKANHSTASARATAPAGHRAILPPARIRASSTMVNRRKVMLGSVASCVAVSSPSLAAAGGGPEEPNDAKILALGRELARALAVYEPFRLEGHRLMKLYRARTPSPAALLVQEGDLELLGRYVELRRLSITDEYRIRDVLALKAGEFGTWQAGADGLSDDAVPLHWVRDAAAADRAQEIVETYDRHDAHARAVSRELGLDKETEQENLAFDKICAVTRRMPLVPAATIEGLRVKAIAAAWCHDEVEIDDPERSTDVRLLWSIIRDLVHSAV